MGSSILVVGGTGLVGGAFLNRITVDEFYKRVTVLTRRKIQWLDDFQRFEQHIIDFDNLENYKDIIKADIVVFAMGTTTKKAGSKENFYKIDHEYPREIAELAKHNGAETCVLISSIGAAPDSKSFYLKIKGKLERTIIRLRYRATHILRPSLLLGPREEFRLGEEIGKTIVKPLSILAPSKYRPVHVQALARKIEKASKNNKRGVFFYEGKQLLEAF